MNVNQLIIIWIFDLSVSANNEDPLGIVHLIGYAPPAYVEEETIEKPAVEVSGPLGTTVFDPVERQRHFGILTYTVNDRFKKMMIILVIMSILLIGIIVTLLVVLLRHGGSEDAGTTPKIVTGSIPMTTTTTQMAALTSQITSANPEKTTVKSSPTIRTHTVPHINPTNPIQTKSPFSPDDTSCKAKTYPATFLFAYSNDLSSKTVLDTWHGFTRYENYADEQYSWDVASTIQNNLPDPNQGFQNSSSGSNVFDVIEKFFSNPQAPVCGSVMLILLKRYPNEVDISRLVSIIRYHHAIVHVMTSATQSGGSQPKTMYSIASKTNGMGAFEYDEYFYSIIGFFPLFAPYPVYATTIQLSGSGTKSLPHCYLPHPDNYYIALTFQDHVPIDLFQNLNLRWTNSEDSGSFQVVSKDISVVWDNGTYSSGWSGFGYTIYSMSLDYSYLGQDVQNLQIRIYSRTPLDNWLPYSD
ncbi:hypothetical protein B9Z55_003360 [Caenorhabditis nigoni]|nr:hypothetical protein B9Z55_003360 [Caenorhabditis nigoni]